MSTSPIFADDVLRTVPAIAAFLGTTERRVYHLVQLGVLPVFREGAVICLRKSTYLRQIESAEARIAKRDSGAAA